MKKKVGILLIAIGIIGSLGGLGIYGGVMYQAVNQLQVNDLKVVHMAFTLNEVTFTVNGIITSPSGVTLALDGGTYDVAINGSFISSGTFGPFSATKTPSIISTDLQIVYSDITFELATILADFGLKLGNLEVTITLTSINWIGITVKLNQQTSQVITPADVGL